MVKVLQIAVLISYDAHNGEVAVVLNVPWSGKQLSPIRCELSVIDLPEGSKDILSPIIFGQDILMSTDQHSSNVSHLIQYDAANRVTKDFLLFGQIKVN